MDPDQTTTVPDPVLDPVIILPEPKLDPVTPPEESLQPITVPKPVTVPEPAPPSSEPSTPEPVATPEPVSTLDVNPSTLGPVAPSEPEPSILEPAPPSSEPSTPEPVVIEQRESQSSTSRPEPTPIPEKVLEPVPAPTLDPPLAPIPPAPVFDVNSLSDGQLKAAAALYAKKNQKVLSQKGVEKRQAIAKENIQNITSFISAHSPASNRTIARALNLPPRRVQHYMQILTHNGTVTATGWGGSRQYFKK